MLVRQVDKTHQTAKFVRNPNSSICLETLFSRRYLKALPEQVRSKVRSPEVIKGQNSPICRSDVDNFQQIDAQLGN